MALRRATFAFSGVQKRGAFDIPDRQRCLVPIEYLWLTKGNGHFKIQNKKLFHLKNSLTFIRNSHYLTLISENAFVLDVISRSTLVQFFLTTHNLRLGGALKRNLSKFAWLAPDRKQFFLSAAPIVSLIPIIR